ncbi:MAG: PIG-L family deacetylase, partial [Comamonas sp.]|nr:PIG-L family deacetylase [Comamonas sp.]
MPMQDRLFEAKTFPQPFPLEQFHRPVLLAPHPDDEVFGCAGLLALWAQRGVHAQVVVLTGGQAQGEVIQRQVESQAAAAVLGGYALDFWHLPDRNLRCTPELVQRIADYVQAHQADLLLVPALHEPHPDHQACALSALWSLVQLPRPVDLCFYESGTALVHCTHLVDIASVQAQKMQAMQAFSSQEEVQPYSSRIAALNHFRALTLGPQVQAAEGFQWLPLAQQGWSALLPALDPLFLHQRGQAIVPQDLPLVSVLIRTVGDSRLEQAIASVCAQSYPQLEIIVVAAHGDSQPPAWFDALPHQARWVCLQRPLTRPQAANAALDHAQGQYCVFLDDDDIFAPGHIDKLVQVLRQQGNMYAAHTDTQVVNLQGQEVLRYDRPYQSQRLIFTNIFPIHSVLFALSLITKHGCRFDETLPVLEDWDFWLQVSMHTSFVHVPGCSAIYRYNDRSQLQGDEHAHHHLQWRQQVMHKWLSRLPIQRIGAAGAWYSQQLDHTEQQRAYAEKVLQQNEHTLQQTQHE